MEKKELRDLLRKNGMRATENRIRVLLYVKKQKHPVGIEILKKEFPKINDVTLYRMATDFVEKGIWLACDVGHGHTDFESAHKPHHHHAVCESCGMIEEVYGCQNECQFLISMKRDAKKFTILHTPSTAVFGLCHACSS